MILLAASMTPARHSSSSTLFDRHESLSFSPLIQATAIQSGNVGHPSGKVVSLFLSLFHYHSIPLRK
jgi:hypothetical protein